MSNFVDNVKGGAKDFFAKTAMKSLQKFFGEEPEPVTTCDMYEVYRARMTETILRLAQGSRGSYLVYDPSGNYYHKFLDRPPYLNKLPTLKSGVLFADDPFANTDRVSPQSGSETCVTKSPPDSPVMSKMMDFFMKAPFMPAKVSKAYKEAKKAGNSTYGRDTLKLIGRGIQVLASNSVQPPSLKEIDEIVVANLKLLNKITRDKYVEQERKFFFNTTTLALYNFFTAISKGLDKILGIQKAVKPKKVEVVYEPSVTANFANRAIFGPHPQPWAYSRLRSKGY